MLKLIRTFISFHRDERGLTTVEYAVAGGLIAVAVVGGFLLLGGNVDGVIRAIADAIG